MTRLESPHPTRHTHPLDPQVQRVLADLEREYSIGRAAPSRRLSSPRRRSSPLPLVE
jgi:hypothetical protein